jgi:hypothetical protein
VEHIVQFATGTATLALFDPDVLAGRVDDYCDWWCGDFLSLEEVVRGDVALIGLGGDGVYKVRVTDGELTSAERAYAADLLHLGLRSQSGQLLVGPGEKLPGEQLTPRRDDPKNARLFCALAPGSYALDVYGIVWHGSPDWYVEPDQPVPDSAPPDVVVRLAPRDGDFEPPTIEPRIFVQTSDRWLFPNEPRRLGPVPGMILRTRVLRKRDDLVLKPCGPGSYRPIMTDMSGLDGNADIDVRVVAVKHDTREFEAELASPRRA